MRKLLLLLILMKSAIGFGQTNHNVIFAPYDAINRKMPTLIHFPKGYSDAKKYPLIVFLHGAGEAGSLDGSQLASIYNNSGAGGPAYYIEHNQWPDSFYVDGKYYAPVVVSPQAPGWSTNGDQCNYIIRYIVNTYSIDPDRIYVTGLSAGGEGTINYSARTLDNSTNNAPAQFSAFYRPAAIVPMSQAIAASQAKAAYTVNDSIRAWGFGSVASDIHGSSEKMQMQYMENIKPGYGRFTDYSGGHCCWNQFYTPNYKETVYGQSLNIYQWMFKHARNQNVNPNPTPEPPANQAPKANAGSDITVTLPLSLVTLNGSGTDPDGTIASYQWRRISGPDVLSLLSPLTAVTNILNLVAGTWEFELKVTDNLGLSATDTMKLTVNPLIPPPNQSPVVSTSAAQTITLPANSVTVTGTASDPDGSIASYEWSKQSGGNATIVSPAGAQTRIEDLTAGVYIFQLTVKDNQGASSSANVTITVLNAPNQAPVVSAGSGQTITLPVSNVTLSGTATDNDGTISSYLWTKVSGGNAIIASETSAQTQVTGLTAGTYVFRLTAKDNSDAVTSNDVQIIVLPAVNTGDAGAGGWSSTPQYVTKVACSEYAAFWLYNDGKCYTYAFNAVNNKTEMTPFNLGGKKVVDVSVGFNICTFIDEDGRAWVSKRNSMIPIRVEDDTTGAAFGNNKNIYGYFFSYATIREDGSIWYWGADDYNFYPGSEIITKPICISAPGVKYTKIHMGKTIIGLTSTGEVHQWMPNAAPNPVVRPTPRPAIDIFGSRWDFYGAIVPDASGSQQMGYPYMWGNDYGFWGGAQAYSTPTSVKSLWNMTIPIKKIDANQNTLAYIDSLGRLFTIGDNVQGELGTGYEWVNHAEINPKPYDWNWGKGTAFASKPTQVLPQSNIQWKNLFSSNVYAFYWWATDENNVAYHWGRDKALVGGRGILSMNEAKYPNGLDVLIPIARNPIQNSPVVNVPFSIYTLDAGNDQTTTNSIVTLTANGTPTSTYTIAGWQWKKISGPGTPIITTPTSRSTTVTGLVPGTYQFSVQMIDNNTATISDTLKIIVNAANYNAAPVAVAGNDQTITLPTSSVTVNGSSSTDADGTIASYQWTKIAGPTQGTIVSPAQAQTVINNLGQGVYRFELTVTDNKGATDKDTVQVTVNAVIIPNQLPVAIAGNNQTITLPVNTVTANGGNSTDADGTISTYQWTKVAGPTQFTIVSPAQAQTVINNLVQGIYKFQLQVVDNKGGIAKDTLQVVVNAAIPANLPPVAIAGTGRTITLPVNTLTLSGTASYDIDGTITAYQWTKIAGPAAGTIGSPTQVQTVINSLVEGTYKFQLQVTDNSGATAKDTVQVTVNAASPGNQLPVAVAGAGQVIILPANSVTANGGSSFDNDGTITAYQWTKVAGPAQFTIVSPTQAQTMINNLVLGTYKFELKVTDNNGAVAKDTLQVIVNAAPPANQAPIAIAGTDKVITLPTNTVSLSGTASYDIDGTVASYQWSKITGPALFAIATPTQAQTNVNNLVAGVYTFELKVTDNKGAIGKDTVKVTVNPVPVPNQPPVAVVGNNVVMTLPTNSLTLNGSTSTDADGVITSYLWKKISGPAQFTMATPSQAQTLVTGLVQGTYEFELTVTDNQGATGKATIMVIVNATAGPANQLPTANAGNSVVITLPTNKVNLSGSGVDPDGLISSYAWKKIAGPVQFGITTPSQASTEVNNLVAGTYTFELTVTDNRGGTGSATVRVTVNPAVVANAAPIAVAGNDQVISLPIDQTVLNGSASSDPDGRIVAYKWAIISNPDQLPAIISATSAQTDVKGLVAGVYFFELTVTDNGGATAKDTVKVTVTPAESSIKVYPNPAVDYIDITIDAATKRNKSTIMIFDVKGNIVYQEPFERQEYRMTKRVNISNFMKGTYVVVVGVDINHTSAKKVVKL